MHAWNTPNEGREGSDYCECAATKYSCPALLLPTSPSFAPGPSLAWQVLSAATTSGSVAGRAYQHGNEFDGCYSNEPLTS